MQRTKRSAGGVLTLSAAILGLTPALASGDAMDESNPTELAIPERSEAASQSSLGGVLPMSLDDAVALGLENNLDVEIARFDPRIADDEASIAWGSYDPTLSGRIDYDDGNEPTGSALIGAIVRTETLDGNARIDQLLPYVGASAYLDFNASRVRTDQNFAVFSPDFNSTWTIGGTIPLARGLIWNQAWTQVRTSRLLSESAAENFRATLMDIIALIEDAYWAVSATAQQRRVAAKSLEAATALAEQVATQYEVGVVSKVDVVEADAGVAERELNLIIAENDYREAQDRLIDQVLGTNLRAGSTLEVQPTDPPDKVIDYHVDLERSVERAFDLRPELASAQKSLETSAIQLRFAKNQRLPQVDIVGNYRFGGLRGQGRTTPALGGGGVTVNPDTGDGIGDTFSSYWDSNGREGYTIGGRISIPIGNTAGRHGVSQSKLELRRAETQVSRLRQTIILEIRNAVRDLYSAQEGIGASERRRLAAEEQLRAERIRLEHGESTPFDVLQRERDLVDAESQKINSFQLYHRSVTALERAQGTLLRSRGVSIEQAAALR